MSQRKATAKGLSDNARQAINQLFSSGSSEEATLAELLDDVASSGEGQETDQFLVQVAEELEDACQWLIRTLRE
jgi:hypothetical protein